MIETLMNKPERISDSPDWKSQQNSILYNCMQMAGITNPFMFVGISSSFLSYLKTTQFFVTAEAIIEKNIQFASKLVSYETKISNFGQVASLTSMNFGPDILKSSRLMSPLPAPNRYNDSQPTIETSQFNTLQQDINIPAFDNRMGTLTPNPELDIDYMTPQLRNKATPIRIRKVRRSNPFTPNRRINPRNQMTLFDLEEQFKACLKSIDAYRDPEYYQEASRFI